MADLLKDLIVGIDHIGVCVDDLDQHAGLWSELCGLAIAHRECVDVQKTEAAFLDMPDGGASIELVAPMDGNDGLVRFLQKRKNGLHHLAFAVTDINLALDRLKNADVPLIDAVPRQGARGHLVAFLHPKAVGGTLVELVERHQQGNS